MPKKAARLEPNRPSQPPDTDKEVKAPPQGSVKQAGSSIVYNTLNLINGFLYNPEANRLHEYERAMLTDDAVGSALDFVRLAILASLGEYRHPNKRVEAFVRENLNRMEGNHIQAIGELALSSLWSGFGLSEIVWKVQDGALWLQRLANYHPASIHIAVDKNGYLDEKGEPMIGGAQKPGVYQLPLQQAGNYIQLPMNKVCLVTHNKRHNNYYGESIVRRAYKAWRYKDPILQMWAIALDRYGTPVAYAIVPRALTGREIPDSSADGGKRSETIADSALEALGNINHSTGLVVENPEGKENPVQIGTLTTGNNYGSSFESMVQYLDRSIYRSILIPQLLLSDGKGGMNSTAQTHFEVFKLMLSALYAEVVEPFTEQVIGRLIRYNFNETDPGEFPMNAWDPTVAELLANNYEKLVTYGMLDPTDVGDLNEVRGRYGLSKRQTSAISSLFDVIPNKQEELRIKELAALAKMENIGNSGTEA